MESFVAVVRPMLELIYFLAGILLAAGLVLAYVQLKAVKADSRMRIKRTAAEKAIEAADRYMTTYIPLANTFFSVCQSKNLPQYESVVGDFSFGSISEDNKSNAALRFAELSWLEALNQLEIVAAILVSGVGDEEVAFPVIGRSFCNTVRSHYDLLAYCRRPGQTDEYFQNIIKLYAIWHPRRLRNEMGVEKDRLESSLNRLPDRKMGTLEERIPGST